MNLANNNDPESGIPDHQVTNNNFGTNINPSVVSSASGAPLLQEDG